MPQRADISIWLGDNAPRMIWQFPFALAGSDMRLTLRFGGRLIHKLASAGEIELDTVNNRVIWAYSDADFRNRSSDAGRYELTRIVPLPGGEVRTYIFGEIAIRRWANG